MIEPRIYRAAFLPAALAVLLVGLSFPARPPSLQQGLPGDVLFDAEATMTEAQDLASSTPDRRVGTDGDRAAADTTRRAFLSRRFATSVDRWSDDGTEMINVVGRRAGSSRRQVVLIAGR